LCKASDKWSDVRHRWDGHRTAAEASAPAHTGWISGYAAKKGGRKETALADVTGADEQDRILVPFVFETYGRLGKDGVEFLQARTNHLHDRAEHP